MKAIVTLSEIPDGQDKTLIEGLIRDVFSSYLKPAKITIEWREK